MQPHPLLHRDLIVCTQVCRLLHREDERDLTTCTQAAEGVRVNLLCWNDATSVKLGKLHNSGMLETHDEETALYFKDSSVNVRADHVPVSLDEKLPTFGELAPLDVDETI